MSEQTKNAPELDLVLEQFAEVSESPDEATLRAFIEKHPNFEKELVDFATEWVASEASMANARVPTEVVASVVNRTMSRVESMLDEEEHDAKVDDLASEIRSAGHDFGSFQRLIGIDRSILDCLVDRLVNPTTVPASLVSSIASALNRTGDEIRNFLRGPPRLAAAHRARTRPRAAQADFAMLVEQSELDDAEKAHWLAEPLDPDLVD